MGPSPPARPGDLTLLRCQRLCPAVVTERAHRGPEPPPRRRAAAKPRCRKRIRFPNRRSNQRAEPASPTRRMRYPATASIEVG